MRKFVLACAALAALTGIAFGEENRVIGNWLLRVDDDRFSDGKTVIAITAQGSTLLAVRCIQKNFSLAISAPAGGFEADDTVAIKFRADANPIVETTGAPINKAIIEVVATPDMRRELLTAREYAFRVTMPNGAESDSVFKAGAAARALPEVLKACPEEK
jgi:hypothetical protein